MMCIVRDDLRLHVPHLSTIMEPVHGVEAPSPLLQEPSHLTRARGPSHPYRNQHSETCSQARAEWERSQLAGKGAGLLVKAWRGTA